MEARPQGHEGHQRHALGACQPIPGEGQHRHAEDHEPTEEVGHHIACEPGERAQGSEADKDRNPAGKASPNSRTSATSTV